MKRYNIIGWLLTVILISHNCKAQKDTTLTDKFKSLSDTTQLRILVELSDLCEVNDMPYYYEKALVIGKNIYDNNPLSEYVIYYSAAYNNKGFYYDQVGDIEQAMESYLIALEIRENNNDSLGMAESYNNLASVIQHQDDMTTALKYYNKSKHIYDKFNDTTGLINVFINVGFIYYIEQKLDSSQLFFEKGLELAKKVNDLGAMGFALNNLSSIYYKNGDYKKTEETYLKSLAIREKVGRKNGIARSHHNLGRFYLKRKKINKSLDHALVAYQLAVEMNSPDVIGDVTILLSDIYYEKKEYKKSHDFLVSHIEMKDSIFSSTTQKAALKQQMKYEYEKQRTIDDAEYEKQLAISAEQEKKQKIIIYAITGGFGLVLLFSVFIFNRLQITRKQKGVIEDQKLVVENQKVLVDEKNKEILDSINYAKRIQSAILPPDKTVKEYLKESFILYKPKDIVAGDFYWMEKQQSKILFAAADCTGHGVPGAMVSVVCNNALNRSVREFGLTDPGKILDKTREIVIQEFEQSDEDVKDGMDIALCLIEGNKLQYAGAHNPLWIIRNGEILETKADKQPIGQFDNPEPYTTNSFMLEKEDSIYIFSDGYLDQFGGKKGKKFKVTAFRELLLSVQDKSMEEQKSIIDVTFENWRRDLEQIDDVCVIGVKFS
jgi:serine phosphatase RsbU (regulator of sigma subunit)